MGHTIGAAIHICVDVAVQRRPQQPTVTLLYCSLALATPLSSAVLLSYRIEQSRRSTLTPHYKIERERDMAKHTPLAAGGPPCTTPQCAIQPPSGQRTPTSGGRDLKSPFHSMLMGRAPPPSTGALGQGSPGSLCPFIFASRCGRGHRPRYLRRPGPTLGTTGIYSFHV